jgi:hypothetical protein
MPAAATRSVTVQVRADADAAPPGAVPIRFTVSDTADATVRVAEPAKFWMP